MFSKLRLIIFCAVAGMAYYAINFYGYNAFAQAEAQVEKSEESQANSPQEVPSQEVPPKVVECKEPHKVSRCRLQGYEEKGCWQRNKCCPDYHPYHGVYHHEDGKSFSESHSASFMLKLAHDAKEELLKEKMKVKLEEKMGKKLDKVADLLVNAMFEEYQAMREGKKRDTELEKKLEEIFSQK